jgi:hypothetical protein
MSGKPYKTSGKYPPNCVKSSPLAKQQLGWQKEDHAEKKVDSSDKAKAKAMSTPVKDKK